MTIAAHAHLPTEYGDFSIYGFENDCDFKEHIVLIKGEVAGKEDVPVRIHSECFTGDCLGSLRCDCMDQLHKAMRHIEKHGYGMIVYLRQEGRGIGLVNKIKAYALQEGGLDTIEANEKLGLKPDYRTYEVAAQLIKLFRPASIQLLTNNPEKIRGLEKEGIRVTKRIPLIIKGGIN